MSLRRVAPALLLVASAVLVTACATEASPSPKSITAQGLATINGTVGTAVTPPPSVSVTSSKGGGLAGATVTFVASTGSTITGGTATTDESGIATVGSWMLGQTTGSYTLTATVGSLAPVTITANAAAGAPATVTAVTGQGQTATVGSTVAVPVKVVVKDQYGNPVPSTAVTFTVSAGGGSFPFGAGTTSTDANGEATLTGWKLGNTSGANALSVTAGTATALIVTATGSAGAPAGIEASVGNDQIGGIGTALTTQLGAKIVDGFGNGVSGVAVSFALTSGAATIATPSTTTNAQGIASTSVTLTAAGPTTVTASSTGLGTAPFTVSTGPTITGQITIPVNSIAIPAGTAAAAATSGARTGAGFLTMPRIASAPAVTRAVDMDAVVRRIPTRGRLIVRFRRGAFGVSNSPAAFNDLAAYAEASAVYQAAFDGIKSARLLRREVSPILSAGRLILAEGADQEAVVAELKRDPRIEDVYEEGIASIMTNAVTEVTPAEVERASVGQLMASFRMAPPTTERYASDPMLNQQLWHYRMIDVFRVWPTTTGSNTVRVAVIDTGARPDHPALAGIISNTESYDFVDGATIFNDGARSGTQTLCGGGTFNNFRGTTADNALPRNEAHDPRQLLISGSCWTPNSAGSHGTHVAGTIASAANDGIAGTGVTWNTKLIAVRVLGVTGAGWWFDIAQGILYAGGLPAQAVGGPTVQMPKADIMNISIGGTGLDPVITAAVDAVSANTLIIASAGNNNNSIPSYPGALNGVLAVSALGPTYLRAPYSNFASYVSLSAPGGATSLGTTSGVLSSTWDYVTNTANYSYYQGTSMASPHVVGVAALVKAANPSFTAAQIRDRLINSAIDLGTPGKDNTYGYGLVNAYRAVTGTTGPTTATTVRAINTATGLVARTVTPAVDGSFSMTNLPAGSYVIVAGQDEGGDGLFGLPGRRFGGSAAVQVVSGTQVKNIAISLATLTEAEPNDLTTNAQPLPVSAWVSGTIGAAGDAKDLYSVFIPTAGTYTFETSGVIAACGAAQEANTSLRLLNAAGTQLAQNDDTAYPAASYPGSLCSLISMSLSAGQHYIEVSMSSAVGGSYRLHVRSGN